MTDIPEDVSRLFGSLRSTRFSEKADPNNVVQSNATSTGDVQLGGALSDGVVIATSFDTTAPALPTGLALSSDVATNSDGGTFVRLLIGLVQPADADLYGTYVEVTSQNDGADPPNPVWDRPRLFLIAKGQTQTRWDDVQGVTPFWAKARAVDVLSNYSAYTSTVTHTTVGDTTPPPTPNPATVTAGFRGFSAFWTGGDAIDLSYYQIRWAQTAGAAPDADDGAWTYGSAKVTTVFITNLTPSLQYWFEVRGVDTSGNASGWSTGVAVTPNLIGSTDLAVNSISAAAGHIADLNADKLTAGTLRVSPQAAFADGIEIIDNAGVTIGRWDENGLKVWDATNTSRYILVDGAAIKFTDDNGVSFTTAISADGINASAIILGSLAGGANVIHNSSFEMIGLVAGGATAVFTDNSGTPGWKAANRVTALDNMTEAATNLAATTLTYA